MQLLEPPQKVRERDLKSLRKNKEDTAIPLPSKESLDTYQIFDRDSNIYSERFI